MANASPVSPTDALARLVRQKRRLLEQLVAVGERQQKLIGEGDTTALLQLLSGKQQLIAALRVVESGLDAFRDEDPESRPWPTPQQRAECAADADACNRLLAEVIASEQQQTEEVASRRDAISEQLRQAQSAHAASSAYKPHLRHTTPAPDLSNQPLSATIDLTTTG